MSELLFNELPRPTFRWLRVNHTPASLWGESDKTAAVLVKGNDAIISPYKTYELFFEITFMVIQKLGAYEDIGTPDECLEAMRTARAYQAQYLDNIKDPLEPLKISSALKSELLKLQFRKTEKPESISPLDYTVIAALKEALEKRLGEDGK